MLDMIERQTRLTVNQWKIVVAAILGDMLDFFDFYLIGYVLAFIVGPWQLTFGESAMVLLSAGLGAVPGAGFINVPVSVLFEYDYGSAAFAGVGSNDLEVYTGTSTTYITGSSTGLLDQTAQTFETAVAPVSNIIGNAAALVNQPIYIKTGSTFTGGTGSTLSVTVNYYTYTVVG